MIRTVRRAVVSYETAAALVAAGLAHGEAKGWRLAVAVTDASGALLAFGRHDAAPDPVGGYAIDKAWTAATHAKPTRDFGQRMASDPTLAVGLANRPRALAWEGGLPILSEGAVVGGIGVSGASGPEDAEAAAAALAALGAADA